MKLISTHRHRLWLCHKFLCSIFSKGAQPFDFIKPNLIWKLTYKVQYISQINGGLIMFFQNLRIQLFGLNRYEKRNKQHSSVFKVWKWISFFFKWHRSIDNSIDFFIFLPFCEKAHDNKEFSHENSKPLWITNDDSLSRTLIWLLIRSTKYFFKIYLKNPSFMEQLL